MLLVHITHTNANTTANLWAEAVEGVGGSRAGVVAVVASDGVLTGRASRTVSNADSETKIFPHERLVYLNIIFQLKRYKISKVNILLYML